jgi:WXG100 family type VII secretion target
MANILVNYADLDSSANALKTGQQEVESQLARLKAMIDGLVQGGFKTDLASTKFQQSYEQWTNGARNVIGGLDGMTSFLRTTVAQHQQLDQQLSQSVA